MEIPVVSMWDGTVAAVHVEPGATVAEGEVLAVIDTA
jgi:biotin carboxyl carrier protein